MKLFKKILEWRVKQLVIRDLVRVGIPRDKAKEIFKAHLEDTKTTK